MLKDPPSPFFFNTVILHKTIPENSTIPFPSEKGEKGQCNRREILKSFYENYSFQPIASFEFKDSTDCVRCVNSFLVMYNVYLPQSNECNHNSYVHSKKLSLNSNKM